MPKPQTENFADASKNLLKNRNETFLVVPYPTGKPELASNILWPAVAQA